MKKVKKYDVLIIGAGIAGLNAALHLPSELNVAIVCKKSPWDCNTFYAQGGVAVAVNEEDIPLHIKDTLDAGAGHCDEEAVDVLCNAGRDAIAELIARGMAFDKDDKGNLLYTREAAHSKNRILHAGGDATGMFIHQFLLSKNTHHLITDTIVTDLLLDNGVCYGITIQQGKKQKNLYADNVIIASGGIGSLYEFNTNATTISADLQGICVQKGIPLTDMEMTQFHPTVFVDSKGARKQLLTEALRGEGAHIEDEKGERFLFHYDDEGELASRSKVSKAIFDWKKKTDSQVYLSFKNFEKETFKLRFPTIYNNLKNEGYALPQERVPISPAFHYMMGGIKTTHDGRVEGFTNLYAVGEAAHSGVHGANRLASNSLLEGLVFSLIATENILKTNHKTATKYFEIDDTSLIKPEDKKMKNALRLLMWEKAGILRTQKSLQEALKEIDSMMGNDIGKLLRYRLSTSRVIITSALMRTTSLGAHQIEESE